MREHVQKPGIRGAQNRAILPRRRIARAFRNATRRVTFQTKLADNSRWMHVVIALTAGEKRAQVAHVSGAEELQKADELLANLKYPQQFPDETPVRKATFSFSIRTKDWTSC